MKKSLLFPFLATLLIAVTLEYFGWWWAMPIAGLIAGWALNNGKRGFLFGGLTVSLAWGIWLGILAALSPLGRLSALFAGILGLDAALAFLPFLLALLVAFVLGGLGGWTGAWLKEAGQK